MNAARNRDPVGVVKGNVAKRDAHAARRRHRHAAKVSWNWRCDRGSRDSGVAAANHVFNRNAALRTVARDACSELDCNV